MCRGFLLGATAGRTTLNGEGVQHQDGHSHVVAATVPNLLSYDPAFAYELAVIVREGIRRMYAEQENVFYYVTLYNETYPMAAMPEGCEDGILRGIYRFKRSPLEDDAPRVQLLGAGSLLQQAWEAQQQLAGYGVAADVWSVTSYGQLLRDALAAERWNRLHPQGPRQTPYVLSQLGDAEGPVIAMSDYMTLLADGLSRWLPGRLTTLGTDGFGLSEARPDLRSHFEVAAADITAAALAALVERGAVAASRHEGAMRDLGIDPDRPHPAGWPGLAAP